MKKWFFLVLILLVSFTLFGQAFKESVDALIAIADKCIEENIYVNELYDLSSGTVWGTAVYIPLTNQLTNFVPNIEEEGINGFLVIKFDASSPLVAVEGEIKFTGKRSYGDSVDEVYARIYLLDYNMFVQIDSSFGEFYIATDEPFVVLYLKTTYLKANTDYLVNVKTNTTAVNWTIRMNDARFKKLQQIITELGY